MNKVVFITGSTDGIGLETAKILVSQGHHVLLHGRNSAKLKKVEETLSSLPGGGQVESYMCDLSVISEVDTLAQEVINQHDKIDVLINNAGVFRTSETVTADGLDVRFAVNTIAPYLLTKKLLPLLGVSGRVVNLSSAAQSSVNLDALRGQVKLSDSAAYAESKLAITMWSRAMALSLGNNGPRIIAVNPGSMLASKMVKEGYGVDGRDIQIGAKILVRAAVSDEFENASGKYFDNDSGYFASPHPDALDSKKCEEIVSIIEAILSDM